MFRRLVILAVAPAALLAAGCAPKSADHAAGAAPESTTAAPAVTALEVRNPWVRPTPEDATAGAAYLTIVSPEPDRMLGASVDTTVAASTELHAVVTDSAGSMSMQHVEGIDLPAQTAVELKPGSYHVMLFDLARPLLAGDSVAITLRFEKAGERVVVAPVREP